MLRGTVFFVVANACALPWCAAADAAGASPHAADTAAIAVELLHAYSLIHDDLPAMDDDALRRGQPTTHIAFDEATAILAGDALQALAFSILGEADIRTDRMRVKQLNLLGEAVGFRGMAPVRQLTLNLRVRRCLWML